jgi:branched-chain amino acid transport system permease protein
MCAPCSALFCIKCRHRRYWRGNGGSLALVSYDRGELYGLKGFGAAVTGGLGSYSGSIVGGCCGILESLVGLVSSSYKDAVAMVVLLLVLFLRPVDFWGSEWVAQ